MIGFIAPFKILDHLDRLNVVKETSNEYHCPCPVCGDGGFKIEKKSGKYHGFKCGCEVKDIREAIRPWSEVKGKRKQTTKSIPITKPNPKIELALLSKPATDIPKPESKTIPPWLVKQGVPATAIEREHPILEEKQKKQRNQQNDRQTKGRFEIEEGQ